MSDRRWVIRVLEDGVAVCQSGPMTHPEQVEVVPASMLARAEQHFIERLTSDEVVEAAMLAGIGETIEEFNTRHASEREEWRADYLAALQAAASTLGRGEE